MSNLSLLSLFLACFLLLKLEHSRAQPNADIRPLLKALTADQKQQLTHYLHQLGAQVDEDLQNAYRQLPEHRKKQVLNLLDYYRESARRELLTTVAWSPDTLFLGDVMEGTLHIDSFRVVNTGKHPYWILNMRTTCDCTVVYAPNYPIMPGESAVLRIQFDSRGKLGHSRPVLIVYDNSAPNKRNILHIKAHVLSRKRARMPWEY
ncbi:MAG: DUF1573 domain-containing protein [Saprospiraceae bacterium]|nr:DUF1573 domain-containing protein [Saprospiraceae bacterium]MDW8484942.1 DUF1573 domain-containing protein [Saprospiraceae bacterium]